MNLIERFNQITQEGNMLRIDPNHPLDLYIGLDTHRNRVFLLKSKKKLKKLKSTKSLDINLIESEEENQISIRLNNIQLKDIFLKFIEDIYLITNKEGSENELLNLFYSRIYLWKSTFSNPNSKLLPQSIIRGLIGEIHFLKSYALETYGLEKSLKAWVGPKRFKRDFETNVTWYEVKTKSSDSQSVKITSISQLDVEIEGHLAVVSLDSTEIKTEKSYSLNSIIQEIYSIFDDLEFLEMINSRLEEIGYHYDTGYDDYNYIITNLNIYIIDQASNILRKSQIPESVIEVSYRLNLNYLEKMGG